ncbi:MAG: hypothetical protein H7175_14155 [Burkholderiales bacterium]|nr:hypothetical protein [Anaerolineae bacterium]
MTSALSRSERFKTDLPWVSLLVVLCVLLFGPPSYVDVYEPNSDFSNHIRRAQTWAETGTMFEPVPHVLYHTLVIVAHTIVSGIDWPTAGWIVNVGCYVLLALVLYFVFRRTLSATFDSLSGHTGALIALVIALSLMIVEPITITSWTSRNIIRGYTSINVYHNPTILILKPFAVLLFLYAARAFDVIRAASWGSIAAAAVVSVLAAVAKPSYTIALLPALVLFGAYWMLRKRPLDWRLLLIGVLMPSAIIVGSQYLAEFTGTSANAESSSIVFMPLYVMSVGISKGVVVMRFFFSVAFPLSVYLLNFRRARQSSALNLAWLVFLVAAFYAYFLAESGARIEHGNFFWGAQASLLLLFITSLLFVLRERLLDFPADGSLTMKKRTFLSLALYGLHLVSGLLLLLIYIEGFFGRTNMNNWG